MVVTYIQDDLSINITKKYESKDLFIGFTYRLVYL